MKKSGFTLIELLVVIAIIGILAGVIVGSLGGSRAKAADTKVKGQLHSARQQAEIIYGDYGNAYGSADPSTVDCPAEADTLPGDTKVQELLTSLPSGTATKCVVTAGSRASFALAGSLQAGATGDWWCVDSANFEGLINITTPGDVVDTDDSCSALDAR